MMLTELIPAEMWSVVKVRDSVGDKPIYGEPIIIEATFNEDQAVKLCMRLNEDGRGKVAYQVWKFKRV